MSALDFIKMTDRIDALERRLEALTAEVRNLAPYAKVQQTETLSLKKGKAA